MQVIPTTSDGSSQRSVDLENDAGLQIYRTYWNYVTSTWNMDILDIDGNPILYGQAMVIRRDIVQAYPTVQLKVNDLRIIDIESTNNRTLTTLGATADLVQFADGEFDARFPQEATVREITNVSLDDILQ